MWQDVAIWKDRQNDILFLLVVIMVIVNTEHCMYNMGHVKSSVSGLNPATANPRHTWDTFGSRTILRQHFRLGYRLVSGLRLGLGYWLGQEWPSQLHHWANISAPIIKSIKRAAKLLLMTNSHYFIFTSFSSNFFKDFFENFIFPPLYGYLPKACPPPEIFPTSQQY